MKKTVLLSRKSLMEGFFLSRPIDKYSQSPLIHPVRAFSVSKCSILLYLTLWDQHNMIFRSRKVVPSSAKPESVDAHSLADLTRMDEAFTIASCNLRPSFGSYHPREALAEQGSPLESIGFTAWSQQELTGGQQALSSLARVQTHITSRRPMARHRVGREGSWGLFLLQLPPTELSPSMSQHPKVSGLPAYCSAGLQKRNDPIKIVRAQTFSMHICSLRQTLRSLWITKLNTWLVKSKKKMTAFPLESELLSAHLNILQKTTENLLQRLLGHEMIEKYLQFESSFTSCLIPQWSFLIKLT